MIQQNYHVLRNVYTPVAYLNVIRNFLDGRHFQNFEIISLKLILYGAFKSETICYAIVTLANVSKPTSLGTNINCQFQNLNCSSL